MTPSLILDNRFDPIHPFEYGAEMARLIPKVEFCVITAKGVCLEQQNADVLRAPQDFLIRQFANH